MRHNNNSKSRRLEDLKSSDSGWTTVIQPKDKLLNINLRELWSYRDLCSLFVKRNITTQFKQTVLGPLWYLIQPTMTVIMYMVVFGGIANISTDGLPQPLFYLSGICLWQYFNDCLSKTSSALRHPIRALPRRLCHLSDLDNPRTDTHQLVCPAAAAADSHAGRIGAGFRNPFLEHDNEISRHDAVAGLLRAPVDVCHTRHLPLEHYHQRETAFRNESQPLDRHRRGFQIRHVGRRTVQLDHAGVQLRLHGDAAGNRHRNFQPSPAHIYGHCLRSRRVKEYFGLIRIIRLEKSSDSSFSSD